MRGKGMKMINRKQFIILLISVILLALIILFPPWGYVIVYPGEHHYWRRWLFSEKVFNGKLVGIDSYKRDIQIIFLLIVTAIALFVFRKKRLIKSEQNADDQRITVPDDKVK